MSINIELNSKNLKDNKQKKTKYIVLIVLLAIFTTTILGCLYLTDRFELELNPRTFFKPNPQLQKDSTEKYTNILLIGIDTREENYGLQNTDSIMLMSYNHDKHEIIIISIPRDFFVEVPNQGWYTKINNIYSAGEQQKKGSGLLTLKNVIEKVTNQEIQYYAMINLPAFSQLIDAMGGIEVDVENPFTDYRYPVEGNESIFQTISFDSGIQPMDGRDALRFVRSRHSLDYGEGSDFARARRQQRVLVGIKEKLLSTDTFLNPKKIFEIVSILEENIKYSKITNEDIQATRNIIKKEGLETYSFVLDPSLANYKLITDRGLTYDAYAVGPIAGINNYRDLHIYLEHAFKNPAIYSKNPAIRIYDAGNGYSNTATFSAQMSKKLPYIDIQFLGTTPNQVNGQHIFQNTTNPDHKKILISLSKMFQIKNNEKPSSIKELSLFGDFIILMGKEKGEKPNDN